MRPAIKRRWLPCLMLSASASSSTHSTLTPCSRCVQQELNPTLCQFLSHTRRGCPRVSPHTQLEVGGLSKQIRQLFRRVFSSRSLPASVLAGLGVNHVKGVLLYGPPGVSR